MCHPRFPIVFFDACELFQEDLALYRPGYFHPVSLKDIIRPDAVSSASRTQGAPRGYRILHKLGAGGEATVWLAQELDNLDRAVSLKIYSAHCTSAGEREARALKASMVSPNTPGSRHIISLLDDFTISGPNGTHRVHVTDVVMPLVSCPLPASWKREVVRELARGLAHVHHCGFVHGGPFMLDTFPYTDRIVLMVCDSPRYSCQERRLHHAVPICRLREPYRCHDAGPLPYDVTMVIPEDPARTAPPCLLAF
ncbi:hypothetical protein C8T65DRAFT_572797 [Cerioporus squamosus]|nr:hypothetical protein C8T65DRAFT_572797 [Cerioporus squamosus]